MLLLLLVLLWGLGHEVDVLPAPRIQRPDPQRTHPGHQASGGTAPWHSPRTAALRECGTQQRMKTKGRYRLKARILRRWFKARSSCVRDGGCTMRVSASLARLGLCRGQYRYTDSGDTWVYGPARGLVLSLRSVGKRLQCEKRGCAVPDPAGPPGLRETHRSSPRGTRTGPAPGCSCPSPR